MSIHLGRQEGRLKSIELNRVNYHKALPHLYKIISRDQTDYQLTLNKIHIEHSSLNEDDYFALKNILNQCSELFIIELISNHFDMLQSHKVLGDLGNSHLKSLSFTDNWIGEKIPDDFFKFMSQQNDIKSLDFSVNWLRDKGIAKLVDSLNPSLKHLQLSCNDFNAEGMQAVCRFALTNPKLVGIDVSYNHLDAKAAGYIARMINDSTAIHSIKINSNQIGDGGAVIIADSLRTNTKSFHLDLSDNQISMIGAKYLIKSAACDGVKRQLDLRFNSLNPSELEQIVKGLDDTNPLLSVLY